MNELLETWLQAKDWEGFYEISSHGRVRSVDRSMTRKNGAPLTLKGKVLSSAISGENGYLVVTLSGNGISKTVPVHRFVAASFLKKNDPTFNEVDHINRIKTDNRKDNLRWTNSHGNKLNRSPDSKGVSGRVGVIQDFYRSGARFWRAKIHFRGKNQYLGCSSSKEEAIKMRIAEEIKFFGHQLS